MIGSYMAFGRVRMPPEATTGQTSICAPSARYKAYTPTQWRPSALLEEAAKVKRLEASTRAWSELAALANKPREKSEGFRAGLTLARNPLVRSSALALPAQPAVVISQPSEHCDSSV